MKEPYYTVPYLQGLFHPIITGSGANLCQECMRQLTQAPAWRSSKVHLEPARDIQSLKLTARLLLKMDGWKTFSFPCGAKSLFSGAMWCCFSSVQTKKIIQTPIEEVLGPPKHLLKQTAFRGSKHRSSPGMTGGFWRSRGK